MSRRYTLGDEVAALADAARDLALNGNPQLAATAV